MKKYPHIKYKTVRYHGRKEYRILVLLELDDENETLEWYDLRELQQILREQEKEDKEED